jgi:hypothetical protein
LKLATALRFCAKGSSALRSIRIVASEKPVPTAPA